MVSGRQGIGGGVIGPTTQAELPCRKTREQRVRRRDSLSAVDKKEKSFVGVFSVRMTERGGDQV